MSTYRNRPRSRYRRAVKVVWYKDFALLVKLLPPVFLVVIALLALLVISINNDQGPNNNSGKTTSSGSNGMGSEASPSAPTSSEEDEPVTANDRFGWNLILVNTEHRLPDDYEETDLTTFGPGRLECDARVKPYIEQMIDDAKEAGYTIAPISTYRTVAKQTELFNNKVEEVMRDQHLNKLEAEREAAKVVAYPGTSEHNTGLAFDIACEGHFDLTQTFADTDEFKWLEKHCTDYGFILRYPEDKVALTGIDYEPWHYRYVGKKHAKAMVEKNMCLEEYIDYLATMDGSAPSSSGNSSAGTVTSGGLSAAQ